MPDIHIEREHHLGLPAARQLAEKWVDEAEKKFDMACRQELCDDMAADSAQDTMHFQRAGASGTLKVTKDRFVLDARLGFLLGTFKDRIEAEIAKNLDVLLSETPAASRKPSRKKPV